MDQKKSPSPGDASARYLGSLGRGAITGGLIGLAFPIIWAAILTWGVGGLSLGALWIAHLGGAIGWEVGLVLGSTVGLATAWCCQSIRSPLKATALGGFIGWSIWLLCGAGVGLLVAAAFSIPLDGLGLLTAILGILSLGGVVPGAYAGFWMGRQNRRLASTCPTP